MPQERQIPIYQLGTIDPITFVNGDPIPKLNLTTKKKYTIYSGCDLVVYIDGEKVGLLQSVQWKQHEGWATGQFVELLHSASIFTIGKAFKTLKIIAVNEYGIDTTLIEIENIIITQIKCSAHLEDIVVTRTIDWAMDLTAADSEED